MEGGLGRHIIYPLLLATWQDPYEYRMNEWMDGCFELHLRKLGARLSLASSVRNVATAFPCERSHAKQVWCGWLS